MQKNEKTEEPSVFENREDGRHRDVKGALFDLDGTLLDTMGMWETAGEDFLIRRGGTPKPGLGERLYTMTTWQAAKIFRDEYQLPGTAEEIAREIQEEIAGYYRESAPLKPGAKALLKELFARGTAIVLATATEAPLARAALERTGVLQYFKGIVTCSMAGAPKEDPAVYRMALGVAGTTRRDTIVFEDALFALRTAKADGFFVAGVADQHEKTDLVAQEADLYIKNLANWKEWLREITF